MSKQKALRDIDYAAVGMMGLYVISFRADISSVFDVLMILLFLFATICFWLALRYQVLVKFPVRLIFVVLSGFLVALMPALRNSHALVAVFLLSVLFFSTSNTKWGRSLRSLCGITTASVMFASFPVVFGLPAAILAIIVFIGGLLSLWSGLSLNAAILWFASRSLRRETFFLILFLTGIGAIGIRQAQNFRGNQIGISGISEMVSPGGLNKLVLSQELAAKIQFAAPPIFDPSSSYIRGAALDKADGYRWTSVAGRIQNSIKSMPSDFSYQVWLSPRHNQFTPVVDYGVKVQTMESRSEFIYPRDNGVFSAGEFHSSWRRYRGFSRDVPIHGVDPMEFGPLLSIGGRVDDRVKKLALQLGSDSADVKHFMKNLGQYFTEQGFRYKLSLNASVASVEEFLFVGKEGFCEHYAVAAATLARLAGFPARIVSGFLGGFWDDSSLTLYVRDLDAHAWNEFFDPIEKTWIRFDSVSILAPSRIDHGAADYLRLMGYEIPDDVVLNQHLWLADFLIDFDSVMTGINSQLSFKAAETFVEYGEELALLGAFGLTLSYIFLVVRRHRENSKNPELELVRTLERCLEKRVKKRAPSEPVYDWLLRCQSELQEAKEDINVFAAAHSRFCHSAMRSDDDLKVMAEQLKKIRSTASKV